MMVKNNFLPMTSFFFFTKIKFTYIHVSFLSLIDNYIKIIKILEVLLYN